MIFKFSFYFTSSLRFDKMQGVNLLIIQSTVANGLITVLTTRIKFLSISSDIKTATLT